MTDRPTPEPEERAKFEAWAQKPEPEGFGFTYQPEREKVGAGYVDWLVDVAWSAWQARAALASSGEQESDARDAARYRWLRNQPPTYSDGHPRNYAWIDVAYTMYYDEVNERLGAELDAAIDAALSPSTGTNPDS